MLGIALLSHKYLCNPLVISLYGLVHLEDKGYTFLLLVTSVAEVEEVCAGLRGQTLLMTHVGVEKCTHMSKS